MSGLGKLGSQGIGTCPCHRSPQDYITTIISGATTVNVNGVSAAQVGSLGVSTCGHMTVALSGSSSVFAEGKQVHRVGDTGENCGPYTLISGSSNTFNTR